jgi:ABC-type lipoprotein export system ATPase subunit/glycosyltransferase involved in cell wall biosynthesis
MPRWLSRGLDSPRLLRWVGRFAGMTNASAVGPLSLSMLRGLEGAQAAEFARLLEWLRSNRPDVVVLSDLMLLGVTGAVRRRLDCAVVCLLQDDDGFLDAMGPWAESVWAEVRRMARRVDLFVPASRYYHDVMLPRLGVPAGRLAVVYPGASADGEPAASPPKPRAIGYLSRLCGSRGLHNLVAAFIRLRADAAFSDVRLLAAGGSTFQDRGYLRGLRRQLEQADLLSDVEFLPALEGAEKSAFLRRLTVLSVPSPKPEAFSVYALEALAAGVPVVLPRHPSAEELVDTVGGGVLVRPEDPEDLAGALGKLLADPPAAHALGASGRKAVLEKFSVDRAAGRFIELCNGLLESRRAVAAGTASLSFHPSPLEGEGRVRGSLAAEAILEIRGLGKHYDTPAGPLAVLANVDLSLKAGESLAILGPSGSGKSTLLNIIGGLDRPTAGSVLLDGQDIWALGEADLAALRNRRIGFVFQLHHLLPQCTVLENVLLPTLAIPSSVADAAENRDRAEALLKAVGLADRMTHRPGQLSGGERQRVAVARALINRPALLLADEPTGSLDHASAEALGELLAQLNAREGVTLIAVTHSADLAARMHSRLMLRDLRLVGQA